MSNATVDNQRNFMAGWTTRYNDSHIAFEGIPFNLTTLNAFNLTIFPNGTVSNSSRCWLAHDIYRPILLENGTFLYADSCDAPINPISIRGGVGICFAGLFGIALVFVLQALKKHGKSYLPEKKGFRLVGRRWPWYWAIATCALGMISGFTSIDVDRAYIPRMNVAITLTSIFYCFMMPCILAMTWEMVRNWHTFRERLIIDADEFHFPPDDRRSKIEFYMPMIVYLWIFLSFFLAVMRDWSQVKKQNPNAITDARFQASAIFGLIALITIAIACGFARHYYRPPGKWGGIPWKIPVVMGFVLVRVGYSIASAWVFEASPLRIGTSSGLIYGLGYAPVLLAVMAMIESGRQEMNEDKVIIAQRKEREKEAMRELREMDRARREELRKNRLVDDDVESQSGLPPVGGSGFPSPLSPIGGSGTKMGEVKEKKGPVMKVDSMIDGATISGPSRPERAAQAAHGRVEPVRSRSSEEDALMQPN